LPSGQTCIYSAEGDIYTPAKRTVVGKKGMKNNNNKYKSAHWAVYRGEKMSTKTEDDPLIWNSLVSMWQ